MRAPTPAQALLAVAAFATPLLGGFVPIEPQPISPGAGSMILAVVGGSAAPSLAHAFVAMIAALAVAIQLLSKRVVQIPFTSTWLAVAALAASVLGSLALSQFPWQSLAGVAEWLAYWLVFFGAAFCCGRGDGLKWVLGGLVLGCLVVAWIGIREYGAARASDPGWRIFSTWMNPNALGGMLLFGFFGGVGMTLSTRRLAALAWAGVSAIIGLAIGLTQSKGALLASLIPAFLLVVPCLWFWLGGRTERLALLGRLTGIGLTLVALLLVATRVSKWNSASGASSPGLMTRFAQAGAEQHSSAFRTLLWRSSIDLALSHPAGVGPGTFRFHSARPGRVTQTQMAHSSYFQLLAESGWVALASLLLLGAQWLWQLFRGAKSQPAEIAGLKAGLLGAFLAAAIHNGVDSDLAFFGTGFSLFLVMGAGFAANTDSLTPEQIPLGLRAPLAAAAFVPALILAWIGWGEALKGRIVDDLRSMRAEDAMNGMESLRIMGSRDGDAWFLIAQGERSFEARIAALEKAAELCPKPRHFRALARELQAAGRGASAEAALRKALYWDPNNLSALLLLMRLQNELKDFEAARETARRLVAVERSDYYRVRATPEFVPTETFQARVFLFSTEPDLGRRIAGLEPALAGYKKYLGSTVPIVANAARLDPGISLGGVSLEDAIEAMREGEEVAILLASSYSEVAEGARASEARGAAEEFAAARSALASLRR